MIPTMEPLLSPPGLASLAFLANGRSLYAFDFDGTLAPISERPEDVRIETSLARKLSLLASLAPVAIITGRRIDDLRGRLGFVPHAVVGNHGAERRAGLHADSRWVDALAPLRERLVAMRDEFSQVGVRMEDKLQSIALHYRSAPDADVAREAISRALAPPLRGLRRFEGKRVVNVVAEQAPDKAHAARALLAEVHCDRLFFAGDDLNDEPVFESALPDWVTVKVGPERPSGARFSLEDQAQVGMAVDCILQTLSARREL